MSKDRQKNSVQESDAAAIAPEIESNRRLLGRLFFRLLPFQVILLVVTAITGIVDTLFASNCIGDNAMSAIGFYSPINHFLYALSIMMVSGSQLLIGEYMGKNKKESVFAYFSSDLVLSFVVSVLVSLLFILAAVTDATRVFSLSDAGREAFNMYLIGQAVGIPALVIGQQFFAFLSMENKTKLMLIASIVCVLVNTVMDAAFVLWLKLGTLGLGLGTSMGMWLFLIIMSVYYISGKSEMKFSFKRVSAGASGTILRRGYTGSISRFVEMFRNIIVNMLILHFIGSVGLSAFAGVNSVMSVLWPVPFGMVATARVLMSISLGEEDRRSLVDIFKIICTRCLLLQCVLSALVIVLSDPLTRMFYSDTSDPVYAMTRMGFCIMPLCMPFAVVSLFVASYGQAMKIRYYSTVLPILEGAGYMVLWAIILIPEMHMTGLYIANVLNGVCMIASILIYVIIRLKRIPKSSEDILLIPESFGAPEEERLDFSVRAMDGVVEVSHRVIAFCTEKNMNPGRTFHYGLAMEEMAGNVVKHGFTADHKKHSIDIRVVHKDDDVILRIRDNCPQFDPLSRAGILDNDDRAANIGIRIVLGVAQDVHYQNLLGLNVLTIRV